jgi:MFS transporter, SET family, sugar efflux transporter
MSVVMSRLGIHLNRTLLVFMAVTFLSGMGAALFVPTMSLFLTEAVGATPLAVGCFYTLNAFMGILVSQLLARYSDRKGSRKYLIFTCLSFGILACLLFAESRSYWVLATLGIGLLSLGATASPQLFALAREHSDAQGDRSVMFTSLMRAQFSLAWVVGPPIAFAISVHFGFAWLFILGAGIYLCSAILVWRGLPPGGSVVTAGRIDGSGFWRDSNVRWLFCASMLSWTCNSMYLINMPLYLSRELHLPQGLAGWMMGTAAALEIPIMLGAGHLSGRWGKKPMLLVATVSGIGFYVGMSTLSSPWALLALQGANALFIGILAGLGMVYFQDLMPGQLGQATTLFTNSIRTGAILAGLMAGVIAEYWSYHGVFVLAIGFTTVSMLLLWRVRTV